MHALTKPRRAGAAGGRQLPAPARARAEDRGADLAGARRDDVRRAEGGGRGRAAADAERARARAARRRSSRRSPPTRRPRARSGSCSGCGLAALQAVVEALREHPAAVEVSEAGSARRRRETFRDLDVIATATDAPALIEYFVGLPWVAEVVAKGETKATVVFNDGLRVDLRVVPPECYGNLLQHFTGSKDHNVALREEAVRRGFSISEYGVTTVETGDVATFATEEELYAHLGYAYIPPELRENRRRAGRGAERRPAGADRGRRPPRRPAQPLDLVERRQGHDRGDGARGARARLRVPRAHRPLPLPARGPARAAGGGDRRAERAAGALPDPARASR